MQKLLTWSLQGKSEHETKDPVFTNAPGGGISLDEKFDVISVQFAIHYDANQNTSSSLFQTASDVLEIGGNLPSAQP
jgi:mRNA (guanine-N7-)-methyltransferase